MGFRKKGGKGPKRMRVFVVLLFCLLWLQPAQAEPLRVAYVSIGGAHAPLWVAREAG